MNRREMFGTLGAFGTGLGTLTCTADHVEQKDNHATPLSGGHAHFCGIHMAKNNPKFQIVTQHYCAAHSGGMFQCVLFDSTGKDAKLLGIEYIISDEMYQKLPADEKKYWHVHTYEVLSGGLIAPGMEPAKEEEFMKMILTTWGKAWHTWPDPKTPVPMGEPLLIWSLTADGQVDEALVAGRDKEFKIETAKIRERRITQIGSEPPKVSLPKDMNTLGRQWTDSGDDKPTPKK
ncbi:hypothetical protein BH11PLA2_BH11PLA2_12250 [soil metagenome]